MNTRLVRSGWTRHNLSDLLAEAEYGISDPTVDDGDLPLVSMRDVTNGKINLKNLPTVYRDDVDIDRYRLRAGDILFNRTNSIELVGKTGIVEEEPLEDVVFASYLVRFRSVPSRALPDYLNLVLNSPAGKGRLRELATRGVSQANINPTTLGKFFSIAVPPIPQQRGIVRVIDAWTKSVRITDRLVESKQRLQRGLTQLLTSPSNYGIVSWLEKSIDTVASEVKRYNRASSDLPVVSCTKHRGLVLASEFFGKRIHAIDTSRYKVVHRNEYVYATSHIEEGSIGYQREFDEALVSPMYTVFRTDPSKIDDRFLFRIFKTEAYRRQFEAATSGTVNRRGSLRWKEFRRLRVPVPPIEDQRRIADAFDLMDREISLLKQCRELLERQKRAVMHKLLTGEIELRTTD